MAGESTTTTAGLTPEQLEALETRLAENQAKAMNNMFTARMGAVEKKIANTVTESLGKTLEEKLSVLQIPRRGEEDPDGKGKGGEEPDGKGKKSQELAQVRAELNALRTRQEETERERQNLLARQREMSLRADTARILNGAGIVGDRFEAAYALLVQTGKIKSSEDPTSIEGVYVDPVAGGDIPLEQGLQQWLKSETAKIFLPAKGVVGSGGARPGTAPNGKPLTDADRRSIIASRLVDELGK